MTLLELLLLIRAMDRGEHPGWEYINFQPAGEAYMMIAAYQGWQFVLASAADFTRTKTAIQVGVEKDREARAKGE